jgi:hypothetical protein
MTHLKPDHGTASLWQAAWRRNKAARVRMYLRSPWLRRRMRLQ